MYTQRVLVASTLFASCLLSALPAKAVMIPWTIDSSASSVTIGAADQTATINGQMWPTRMRNQVGASTAWTVGATAPLSGSLFTNYVDGVSVEFIANQFQVIAAGQNPYRPNPAYWNGTTYTNSTLAPADFAAKVQVNYLFLGFVDAGYLSFREVLFDLASGLLPITGSVLPSNSLLISGSGQAQLDSLVSVIVPDFNATLALSGVNAASTASITIPDPVNSPNLRRLQITITVPNAPISFQNTQMVGTLSGTVVAFATVPEPSSLLLAAAGGAVCLAAAFRRRHSRGRCS